MRSVVLALGVVLLLTSAVAAYRYQHDLQRWEPDAAIYLRMVLEDRGLSRDAARADADRFVMTTSEGRNPASRGFYGPAPPAFYARQFDLFTTRPLFPHLGALLYPRFGAHALQAISSAAYVLATGLMFVVLLSVAPPWIAALGSAAFAANPAVLGMATYGLTDELAVLFWIAALGAIAAYARAPSTAALVAVAAASLALAFTRPAFYLPLGAALGALAAARSGLVPRRTALALVAVTGCAGAIFVAYALAIHGAGVREQLAWQYDFARATGLAPAEQGLVAWYVRAELAAIVKLVVHETVANAGVFMLALAATGLIVRRGTSLAAVLVGGACATAAALLVNPLEFVRTVELPLVPIVTVLATAAFAAWVSRSAPRAAAQPTSR
jgi:hypothetical protein